MLSSAAPTSTTAGLAGQVPKESEGPGAATISSAAPDSSTTEMAKDIPLEKTHTGSSALPGTFPETPAGEPETFSVNPIPATEGIGNPVHLAPGEKVPDPSTLTSNTVQSTVTTDKESFEKGGENVPATMSKEEGDSGAFSVPPVTKNMIPESSLPIGEGETKGLETDTGPTIQSAAPDSTTAGLAGEVPKEPRGQATTVDDTPADPPATTNGESKKEEAGIIAGAGAAVAAGGAAVASAVGDKKEEEPSTSIAADVPEAVKESILESKTSPEAAGNEEAVEEKKIMEAELKKEVSVDETRRVPEDPPSAQPITTEEDTSDTKLKAPESNPPRQQSRDLSPHSRPSGPPAPAQTPAKTPTSVPTSTTSSPFKATEETPTKDKKKKRASGFWSKIKEKLK